MPPPSAPPTWWKSPSSPMTRWWRRRRSTTPWTPTSRSQYAAKHRAVDSANHLLEKQAADLRRQVHDAEERMSAYRSGHALSQGMHAGTDTEEITHLTEDLAKAQSDRAAANARLDAARGQVGRRGPGRGRAIGDAVARATGATGRADQGAADPAGQRPSRRARPEPAIRRRPARAERRDRPCRRGDGSGAARGDRTRARRWKASSTRRRSRRKIRPGRRSR